MADPTTTTTTDSKTNMKWKDCMRIIATDDRLLSCEESVAPPSKSGQNQQRCYDITNWLTYLDAIEERIDEYNVHSNNSSTLTKKKKSEDDISKTKIIIRDLRYLREFIGQRALRLLPRSYKLWKRQWEFLFDWEKKLQLQLQQSKDNMDDMDKDANNIITEEDIEYLNQISIPNAMKRSLFTLHAMPKPWIVYMEWILRQAQQKHGSSDDSPYDDTLTNINIISPTEIRRTMNHALQSVPVTQHDKLWPIILQLAERCLPLQSRLRLLSRYCIYEPNYEFEYANILTQNQQWGMASKAYYNLLMKTDGGTKVDDSSGSGVDGGTSSTTDDGDSTGDNDNVWSSFVSVCSQHPVEAAGVPWESMVRAVLMNEGSSSTSSPSTAASASAALRSSSSSSLLHGYLWSQIADSYVRQGMFDLARSVYEEGMMKVNTVRDFTVLYQAYLNLEEGLLQEAAAAAADADEDEEEETSGEGGDGEDDEAVAVGDPDDWDLLLSTATGGAAGGTSTTTSNSKLADMEWSLARAEHLTERRPYLINAVMLRQNPNDVKEWLVRSELFANSASTSSDSDSTGQLRRAAQVLEEGLKTVQANKAANGTLSDIVRQLVTVYEKDESGGGGLDQARELLDRVCKQCVYRFYKADQLADCWITWIEFELRHERWDDALALARESVAGGGRPQGGYHLNLTRSLRLWDLLLDLEESLGTTQTTKDAYNAALETKVATVQHVLNYSNFLIEHKYFEEAFAAYEKGVSMFAFPHVGAKLLWKEYLQAFLKRYEGTKIERTRDLFERCIEGCPAETVGEFYIMNGSFEEEYGLVKRALSVYKSMCDKVPKEEKLTAYKLWIVKTTKYLGLTSTRDIYQNALEKLDDPSAASLCLDFVTMETSLHEIDRARAILNYGAQMADPRRLPEYWKAWNEFEIGHGNEETFREMLRVKRSVEAAFSTVINYNAPGGGAGSGDGKGDNKKALTEEEAMRMIASQEGVDLEKQRRASQATTIAGFVPSSKRPAETSLDDVEERVAKLRKATGAAELEAAADKGGGGDGEDDDDDEIDIDDIDAEIEEAAAEGEAAEAVAEESTTKEEAKSNDTGSSTKAVKGVSTKAIPAAVFGGLKNS